MFSWLIARLMMVKFEPLEKPNIDHGSGLERIAAARLNDPDVFQDKFNLAYHRKTRKT
jgi:alanyl-tRNA synthetase